MVSFVTFCYVCPHEVCYDRACTEWLYDYGSNVRGFAGDQTVRDLKELISFGYRIKPKDIISADYEAMSEINEIFSYSVKIDPLLVFAWRNDYGYIYGKIEDRAITFIENDLVDAYYKSNYKYMPIDNYINGFDMENYFKNM